MKKQYGTLVSNASKQVIAGLVLLMSTQAWGFSLISYKGTPARWAEGQSIEIEVDPRFDPYIDENGCDGVGSCEQTLSIVQKSINAWKKTSNVNINISKVSAVKINNTPHYDGKNQIKMYSNGWNNLPFNPPSSALAVTISTYQDPNTIVDADIFINADTFAWANVDSNGESNRYDVQNVLTHEFGHFLGLDHSSESSNEINSNYFDATMFFASRPGEVFRRELSNLDVLGIQHLYTSENMPQPVVDEFTPGTIHVEAQNATIEIFGENFTPTASVIIVRETQQGDMNARIIAIESDRIIAKIPAASLKTGIYDVVIANSYNKFVHLEKSLEINNQYLFGSYEDDQKLLASQGAGCQSSNSSTLFLIILGFGALALGRKKHLSIQ